MLSKTYEQRFNSNIIFLIFLFFKVTFLFSPYLLIDSIDFFLNFSRFYNFDIGSNGGGFEILIYLRKYVRGGIVIYTQASNVIYVNWSCCL